MGIFIYFLVEQYTFIIIWLLILFCIWPVIRKVWPSAVKDWNCPCVDKFNVIYCIWGGGGLMWRWWACAEKVDASAPPQRLQHHSRVVSVFVRRSLTDKPSIVSFTHLVTALTFSPVARRDGAEQCFCVYLCSSPIPRCIMTPHPWLAPSCSALPPICFPFTDSVPLSLPSRSAAAFLSSFPLLPVKEWQRRRSEEEREAGMPHSVLCWYLWTIPLLLQLLQSSFCGYLCGKRWQSLGSNSEVGTFDRYVTHGLVADRRATGNAVRCGRLRQMLCIFSAFWLSDQGVFKRVIKASFSSGLSFIGTHKCTLSSC